MDVGLAAVLFGGFVLHTLFRWKNPFMGTDTYFHLTFTEAVRRNGHRIPQKIDAFLEDQVIDQPPLFYWICSFIPKGLLRRFHGFLNPILLGIFAVLAQVTRCCLWGARLGRRWHGAVVFLVPECAFQSYEFSPRFAMNLAGALALLAAWHGFQAADAGLLAVGAVLAGMVVLSHRFSNQTLLFFAVALTVWGEFYILPVYAAGFALACLRTPRIFRSFCAGISCTAASSSI